MPRALPTTHVPLVHSVMEAAAAAAVWAASNELNGASDRDAAVGLAEQDVERDSGAVAVVEHGRVKPNLGRVAVLRVPAVGPHCRHLPQLTPPIHFWHWRRHHGR